MTSFMVVDDETGFCPTFPCEREQGRFARSFEGMLLERSGMTMNMFEGELSFSLIARAVGS
mgnify:CR=1 FL=1